MTSTTVGIALGGGGARGLAHIALLEVLDDLDRKPVAMAGTSIGAIIGALYATGMPAREIRAAINEMMLLPRSITEAWETKRLFGWIDLLSVQIGRNNLLSADIFLDKLGGLLGVGSFEELEIPMKVVAADFWAREEVVFDSGPILPAIAASFCLPGIFKPSVVGGRTLIDGGCVNPVPFDLINGDCDFVIAVDVLGARSPSNDESAPSYAEAVFNAFQIAEKSIVIEKIRQQAPNLYLEPQIENVKMLDFHKAELIYEHAQPECRKLAEALESLD